MFRQRKKIRNIRITKTNEEVIDGLVVLNRYHNSDHIVSVAFLSRAVMILLMFTFDAFISDYDTSSSLNQKTDAFCARVESVAVWDAVHVLRIAEVGDYEYEHSRAFYPALPFFLRFIHRGEVSTCALTCTALILNSLVSIITVANMEKLAFILLANPQSGRALDISFATKCASFARTAALLYCFNPASIFHLAPGYTEAMFTFCATYGALLFARGTVYAFDESCNITWGYFMNKGASYVFFALAASFRSNGILLGIYPACEIVSLLLVVMRERKFWSKLISLPAHIFGGICIALPTIMVQYAAYVNFCGTHSRYNNSNNKAIPRPWCSKFPPNVYTFIQSEYWDVGFLRSWRFSQIPNILIASPALLASVYCLMKYAFVRNKIVSPVGAIAGDILWLLSCLLCTTLTHIQISMRFLSTLATPYIYIARCGAEESERGKYIIASFIAAYGLVGIVLFSNFYPWT